MCTEWRQNMEVVSACKFVRMVRAENYRTNLKLNSVLSVHSWSLRYCLITFRIGSPAQVLLYINIKSNFIDFLKNGLSYKSWYVT